MNRRARIREATAIALCFFLMFAPVGRAAEPGYGEALNDWCLQLISAPADLVSGTAPVRMALIDSGVRADSPYLRPGSIAPGFNYVTESPVTNDLIGHGTNVAAIIAGVASEKYRPGIGGTATIVPLVLVTKYPSGVLAKGDVAAFARAIRDAVDTHDCQIINLSLGVDTDDPALRSAIAHAEEEGVIVIASVGNANRSAPDEVFYPAAYPTVVGVGSVDRDSCVSDFSQRNASVMVTAPGDGVTVPTVDSAVAGSAEVSGTSYSAAYVSGFAALLLSRFPVMTPAEFRRVLQESARDLGAPGYDVDYGYGLIDVSRGLALAERQVTCFDDAAGWYEEYIRLVAARGIMVGRSDLRFAPLAPVTRAEFVTILARLSGDTPAGSVSGFVDVAATDWYATYVCWAVRAGVAAGYGGRFNPDAAVSRQDLAVMLSRFVDSRTGLELPDAEAAFADGSSIADYARPAVGKLQRAGIMTGRTEDRFDPTGVATRGEAAKICALVLAMLDARR